MDRILPLPAYIASLAPKHLPDAARLVRLVPDRANAIEYRLDLTEEPIPPARLLELDPRCAIVTYRTSAEGGGFSGSRAEYRARVEAAYEAGASVDVEIRSGLLDDPRFLPDRQRVIGSSHGNRPLTADQFQSAVEAGLAAVKVVVLAPREVADSCACLRGMRLALSPKARLCYFMTGVRGILSRVLGPHFGASLVYGSVEGSTGEGQLPLTDLFETYRIDRQTEIEKLFAIYGADVSRSLSPRIHNALFVRRGLPYLYIPVSASLGATSPGLDLSAVHELESNLFGVSVTNPFKESAAAGAEGDDTVRAIGAANTLIFEDSRRFFGKAWNTDAAAAGQALECLGASGARVLILGSGGAARAAVFAAVRAQCSVTIAGRNQEKVRTLARDFRVQAAPLSDLASISAEVLINATPLGQAEGDPIPFPRSLLRGRPGVLDFVYREKERTPLVAEATERGCRAVDGLEILALQALGQARLFGLADANLSEIQEILAS